MKKTLLLTLLVVVALVAAGFAWQEWGSEPEAQAPEKLVGPTASLGVDITDPRVEEQVAFDASASTAGSRPIAVYRWDFGDNTTASGVQVTHAWQAAGSYRVTVMVENAAGLNATAERNLTVRPQDLNETWNGEGYAVAGGGMYRTYGFVVEPTVEAFNLSVKFEPDPVEARYTFTVQLRNGANETIYNETQTGDFNTVLWFYANFSGDDDRLAGREGQFEVEIKVESNTAGATWRYEGTAAARY